MNDIRDITPELPATKNFVIFLVVVVVVASVTAVVLSLRASL